MKLVKNKTVVYFGKSISSILSNDPLLSDPHTLWSFTDDGLSVKD